LYEDYVTEELGCKADAPYNEVLKAQGKFVEFPEDIADAFNIYKLLATLSDFDITTPKGVVFLDDNIEPNERNALNFYKDYTKCIEINFE